MLLKTVYLFCHVTSMIILQYLEIYFEELEYTHRHTHTQREKLTHTDTHTHTHNNVSLI